MVFLVFHDFRTVWYFLFFMILELVFLVFHDFRTVWYFLFFMILELVFFVFHYIVYDLH